MGTVGIIKALLAHIQSEANPIYRFEQRLSGPQYAIDWQLGGGCLIILLLLAGPIITLIENQANILSSVTVDRLEIVLLFGAGGLLSLSWTVPLALLAGQGIARERTAQTWDVLLSTPFPSDVILLAKGAASIRQLWRLVSGLAVFTTLVGLFLAAPVIGAMAGEISQNGIVGLLLLGVGIGAIAFEHLQEVALAFVIGLIIALGSSSRRTVLLLGLISGLLIRLIPTVVTLVLVPPHPTITLYNIAIMSTVAGSATMLAAAPPVNGLCFVIGTMVLREALVRGLFAWAIRHVRGG